MKLQLELGKSYVTERGETFGPMIMNDDFLLMPGWPFKCSKTGRTFRCDGQYANVKSVNDLLHVHDLVAEKPEPTLDLQKPEVAQPSLLHGIVYDALAGSRGDAQQRLAQRGMQVTELLLQKNRDYGESAWKIPVLSPGITARQAIQCRMSDKVNRLQRLLAGNKAEVSDESIEATMMDLVGYGILWLEAPVE